MRKQNENFKKEILKKEQEDITYKLNRIRLLNKLCTLYIITKPKDLWSNNPYVVETKKYNITDKDCFDYLPDYFVWLSKQMMKPKDLLKDNLYEEDNYETITFNAVRSTISKKWSHYSLQERKEIGIPGSRRELFLYLDTIEEKYSKYFKEEPKKDTEDKPKRKYTKRNKKTKQE